MARRRAGHVLYEKWILAAFVLVIVAIVAPPIIRRFHATEEPSRAIAPPEGSAAVGSGG